MVAEHGGVGERRTAWRIITSVELASGQRVDEVETAVIINIDALSEVIAVLEKSMTGGSFLQSGVGAALRESGQEFGKGVRFRSLQCSVLLV